MKALRFLMIGSLILLSAQCELLEDSTLSMAERLEGRWKVEETDLKAGWYYTEIFISPIDSNRIMIDNFYGLEAGSIYAEISGMRLIVPEQVFANDFTVRGSADISSGYDQMNWVYDIDDGSGIWESFSAVYVKDDLY